MCGLAGMIYPGKDHENIIRKMTKTMSHRGPDSNGTFVGPFDDNRQVALGHRRLAIQDISSLGHQPMSDGDVTVVLNGEIYNVHKLRDRLKKQGHLFRSQSDTEVVLKSYLAWGIDAVSEWNGMFAVAIYDKRNRSLFLIRDRMGVKPLYYRLDEKGLIFASELKPMMQHPAMTKTINKHALSLFLFHGYITAPHAIFEKTFKLEPGKILKYSPKGIEYITYWSLEDAYERTEKLDMPEQEWIAKLDGLFTDSVKDRMISDVPLGGFLSGGVDSSLIVAIMQKIAKKPVKTFTIGFDEHGFDEAPYAKAVAKHLKTDHHELYVQSKDVKSLIPEIPKYYDEPFADSSQLPTMMVSQMAREKVTVALSGDGGDELFCGYGRYYDVLRLKKFVPYAKIANMLPGGRLLAESITSKRKISQFFELTSDAGLINYGYRHYVNRSRFIKSFKSGSDPRYENILTLSDNLQEKFMLQDMVTYLPDDILHKVDRASMAYGLEARAPLVDDHRIVETSFAVPHALKTQQGSKKHVLKQLLYQYVPKELIERPKSGFAIPIYNWLRSDLKYLVDIYLSDDKIKQQQIFDLHAVQTLKKQFFQDNASPLLTRIFGKEMKLGQDGVANRMIWHLLVFQMWYERYM